MKRTHLLFIAGLTISLMLGVVAVVLFINSTALEPAIRIQAITSRALDEGFRPLEPTGIFTPSDVLYLSVRAEHVPPHSIVSARWRYGDSIITVDDQVIGSDGPVYIVGFELRRTDQAWPTGDYSVDVLLNGEVLGAAAFSVVTDGS